jgi:hypothetical protein
MWTWIEKCYLPAAFKMDVKIPIEITLSFCFWISKSFHHLLFWYILNEPWRDCTHKMKCIKRIQGESKLLNKRYFYFNNSLRLNIPNFNTKNILTLFVYLSKGCFFSFLNTFHIFLCSLFFLFDNSFDPRIAKGSSELVDSCSRISGKCVFCLQKLISWIEIGLSEWDVYNTINNFNLIF